MNKAICAISLLLSGVLAGCGSGESDGGSGGGESSPAKAAPSGEATAEQVAKESRGKLKCPPKVATAPRAAGAPVDDVVGVRPGMTYEEAANLVMCSHELMVVNADASRRFNIQTYGETLRQGFSARFAEPRVVKTSQQIMQEMQDRAMARSSNRVVRDMQPGQSKWYVGTMGMPGQEKVIGAAREEWFPEGAYPTVASVEQQLIGKYGTPTRNQKAGSAVHLTWAYDPFGRLITETSPLFHRCNGAADPDGATNYSPDCGIVVAAHIAALRDNPQLSEYIQVGVLDQSGGYEAITGTEQALQQMDAARKAKEVEEAAKKAAGPQL
jgi:hypothetical protein